MQEKANNSGFKIFVKHFTREKTTCMKDYMHPLQERCQTTSSFMLVSANLDSKKTAESIQIS